MRPREIRRARREGRKPVTIRPRPGVAAGPHNRREPVVTAAQLEAAEALRHERDLLFLGAPSDGELFLAMSRARS